MPISEATVQRFREGDAEAFEAVVREFAPVVRGLVSRFWKSSFEQEEAMQEVWVQAYRNREAVDPDRHADFPGWLATLARRRCIDLLRRQGRRVDEAGSDPEAVDALPDAPTQFDEAARAELLEAVALFTGRLPEEHRRFFQLHFVEGRAYPEISEELGVSRIRCKYLKKILVTRARKNRVLLDALERWGGAT